VQSARFQRLFPGLSADALRQLVDSEARQRRGGTVAEFGFGVIDARGDRHELRAWTFHNQHYLLTLAMEEERTADRRIAITSSRA